MFVGWLVETEHFWTYETKNVASLRDYELKKGVVGLYPKLNSPFSDVIAIEYSEQTRDKIEDLSEILHTTRIIPPSVIEDATFA